MQYRAGIYYAYFTHEKNQNPKNLEYLLTVPQLNEKRIQTPSSLPITSSKFFLRLKFFIF